MLSWTDAGAVEHPTTVQIRVQRSYPGRIRAGAPVPTRGMSTPEIESNIRYFTVERDGPRTRPCTGLVLSGVGVATRPHLAELLRAAREWGIERVVLHVGGEDLGAFEPAGPRTGSLPAGSLQDLVDVLVVPLQPIQMGGGLVAGAQAVQACRQMGMAVYVNTVLNWCGVERLEAVARSVLRVRPDGVTFTYPFPINGDDSAHPPPIPRTVAGLQRALRTLKSEGISPRIKGLPACYLGEDRACLQRSANRWYVDADHPRERALLFFPEVVAFHKEDLCRFCSEDSRCDGFFATYLRRPGFPPLDPVEP